ncbi:MAG: type IVB secretion system protein IcmH/DotU [Rhizobiaceae bacterium]|nr:type IVB secretion system protein IcmH/DotU [Rhizobiaceae bacterium]
MSEVAFTEFSGRGGRQDAASSMPAPVSARGSTALARHAARDFQIVSTGSNRLLEGAMPLLGASVRLRGLYHLDDVAALHAHLANEVQAFERASEAAGYDAATVIAARYCICATVDEAVLSHHWGGDSLWPERPLLSLFHNETWGGEKVFAILDRVMAETNRFQDLLELIYYCIGLGFEGKYHVMHNGQAKLHELLETVYRQLEKQQGEPPGRLTFPEQHIVNRPEEISRRLPIWAVPVIGAAIVGAIYMAFDVPLDRQIDHIRASINESLATIEKWVK